MTVGVLVKVQEGIVVAADSATTLSLANGSAQVWNGANKVFHLHRELGVAAITWGLGALGPASIAMIAKDLRRRVMGGDPLFPDWKVDPENYTVRQFVDRLAELFHELYVGQFGPETEFDGSAGFPILGFLVVGYSSESRLPEAWKILITTPVAPPEVTEEAGQDFTGWASYAQPEATQRLFNGFDPALPDMLETLVPEPHRAPTLASLATFQRQPALPAMPLADAIQFAKFLVDVTVGYSHFLLGPDTVGGTVEIAAVTRYEGFKWISRKHYYDRQWNPKEHGHAY